jgi:hypothetical protein
MIDDRDSHFRGIAPFLRLLARIIKRNVSGEFFPILKV